MSRAFIKEAEDDAPEDLPVRPPSPYPNLVTARGLAQLRAALAAEQERVASTPADERAARRRIEAHIAWLEDRIAAARLVTAPPQPGRVGFGATVQVATASEAPRRWQIVGEDEAAPDQGLISWRSPLARALDGAQVGDVVTWSRPAGEVEVEVLAIDDPEPPQR